MGNRHVLFPACTEGKKDEEAEVTERITIFVFFLTKEGTGSDSFQAGFRPPARPIGHGRCNEKGAAGIPRQPITLRAVGYRR